MGSNSRGLDESVAELWSVQGRPELEKLALGPWTSRRRQELLGLLDRIDPVIEELTNAAEQEAKTRPKVVRVMNSIHGVGPLTALAFEVKGLVSSKTFDRADIVRDARYNSPETLFGPSPDGIDPKYSFYRIPPLRRFYMLGL